MRKKASNGSGTVRKRSDGRWEIMYYDDSGKRKSRYFKTQKEAESALREIEHAIETHTYADAGKMTLETWLNGWLDDYASVSDHPATEKAYRYRAAHVIRRIGHVKLSKLTMQDVQRFINGLKAEGLSPKTIFCIYGVFHCAMEQAVQNGLIAKNPTDYCKLPKVRAKEIIPLTDKQIGMMLEEIRKGEELGDPMFLALFTGMREAEICGLSWDAVDFSKGTVTVKRQLQKVKNKETGASSFEILEMTKNSKHRILMPPECVMDCLCKVKEKQNCAMETAGDTWNNPWNLVFTKKDGSYICPQTLLKHFKALCRRAGIGDDFRFHDLRHTFAVLSLQEGDDIKTVQENLGHATASFTLDRYGHVSEKMHRESSERLQKYYDGIKDKQG